MHAPPQAETEVDEDRTRKRIQGATQVGICTLSADRWGTEHPVTVFLI